MKIIEPKLRNEFEYEEENAIPNYQELIEDPYNYLNYDFSNIY